MTQMNDGVYIKATTKISNKQSLLIIPIIKFFNNRNNLNILIQLLNGESFGSKKQSSTSPISLRLIDWFATNYCKKNNIMYNKNLYNNQGGNDDNFNNFFFVHDNYKSQLKECSKKHFDPFCRRDRIRFYYEPNKYFDSTVGQLNFFKWAIENYIIDYIKDNLADIEKDMNDSMSLTITAKQYIKKKDNTDVLSKTIKKTTSRQKRKELSCNANKSFTKYSIPTILTFD